MYLPESRITLLATENAFLTSVLMFSSFSHVSAELSYPYTSHTYARLVVTLVTVSVSVSVPRMSKTLQYNRQRLFHVILVLYLLDTWGRVDRGRIIRC